MLYVFPVGRSRPVGALTYAVRAHQEFCDITELVTVGEAPKGLEPDHHHPSPNTAKAAVNTNGHLRRVAEWALGRGIESFVWTADDVFPLKPWEPVTHVRKYSIVDHLNHYPNHGHYSRLVRDAIALMTEDGYDPAAVPCGAIHRPMLVEAKRALDVLDRVGSGGHFKVLYAAGLDGVVPAGDPKVKNRETIPARVDCVSTDHQSWRYNAGRQLREWFCEPSRWEIAPTSGTAGSAGGRARARHRRHTR